MRCILIVTNLDENARDGDMEELFSTYGHVRSVRINPRKRTCTIEMETLSHARRAADALDGSSLWGRSMRVSILEEKRGIEKTLNRILSMLF
ncbi:MAG: RNA-binding protein [Spirochaetes bacterium]|jgi:RNA recognition motif-containing protein|nr:RNA-binding protein [Spirochaetota bacterium]